MTSPEFATVTGPAYDNRGPLSPMPGEVRFAPVRLDERTAPVHSGAVRTVRARFDRQGDLLHGAPPRPVELWPGVWRVTLPDGESWEARVEAGETVTLAGLRGFVPGPAEVVQTVAVRGVVVESLPAGADPVASWASDTLTLRLPEPPAGQAGRGIASVTGADGVATVTYTDGATDTFALPRAEDGHTPVLDWDGTRLTVDGIPGPDLRGPAPSVEWDGDRLVVDGASSPPLTSTVPGPAPVVQWQGDRLSVGGELGPPLTSTEPGPTTTLSIGTVQTGEAAAASITGDAPEQTLSLTLPRGERGPTGALITAAPGGITSAGRPDIPNTIPDPDVRTQANAAPSGTLFISTDGPQGAWVWQRRGTAWVVIDGDTGWRDCSTDITHPSTPEAQDFFFLRRMGGVVYAQYTPLSHNGVGLPSGKYGWAAPPGFAHFTEQHSGRRMMGAHFSTLYMRDFPAGGYAENPTNAAPRGLFGINIDNQDRNFSRAPFFLSKQPGNTGGGMISYPTDEDWPATLPGTPTT
ncbi:MAG: hypothetical protein Q4F65_13835 [Propionibacteriaceae bacterium]|nr:hypothetical protein [Propionibacteriaceae bacterium]